jgi:hypothetical protein
MQERLGYLVNSAGTDEDSVIKSLQPHEPKVSFLQQPGNLLWLTRPDVPDLCGANASLLWGNRVLSGLSSLGIRCRKHGKKDEKEGDAGT